MKKFYLIALACCVMVTPLQVNAGIILDHTDADDHGFVNGAGNQDGWLYMQRVLENLASVTPNGNKQVVQLGATYGTSTSGSQAFRAAANAFKQSSLASNGWSWINIDGATDIASFLGGGTVGGRDENGAAVAASAGASLATSGIIQLDSGSNVTGGSDNGERTAINAGATALNSFLAGGGSLHSQAQGGTGKYGFLTTLLPAVTFDNFGGSGLALTPDGIAAFPGLTNADLSAGPYHGRFLTTGGLSVLFKGPNNDYIVGIGAAGGSITNPNPPQVPEPGSAFVWGSIACVLGWRRRRA